MGAVYSTVILLKTKKGMELELIKKVKDFIDTTEIADECKLYILESRTMKDIVERIFCGTPMEDVNHGWSGNKFYADFNATYGWYRVMEAVKDIMQDKKYDNGTKINIEIWE